MELWPWVPEPCLLRSPGEMAQSKEAQSKEAQPCLLAHRGPGGHPGPRGLQRGALSAGAVLTKRPDWGLQPHRFIFSPWRLEVHQGAGLAGFP